MFTNIAFPEVLLGPEGFRKLRETCRKQSTNSGTYKSSMVPNCGQKNMFFHDCEIHGYFHPSVYDYRKTASVDVVQLKEFLGNS